MLLDWFRRQFEGVQRIGAIDVHTGLGKYGVDSLLVPYGSDTETFKTLRAQQLLLDGMIKLFFSSIMVPTILLAQGFQHGQDVKGPKLLNNASPVCMEDLTLQSFHKETSDTIGNAARILRRDSITQLRPPWSRK